MDGVFAGFRTGVAWEATSEAFFQPIPDTAFSPLGVFGAYTISADDRPLLDVIGSFDFPFFFTWGADYP
jgi:hypothetical protein